MISGYNIRPPLTGLCLANKLKLPVCVFIILFFSCSRQNDTVNGKIKKELQAADSLSVARKDDAEVVILRQVRPELNYSTPLISTYYCLQAERYRLEPEVMNAFADSALAFFTSEERIIRYQHEYFKSNLIKGDACLSAKKYSDALTHYYKCQEILSNGGCDGGDLASKLGLIYYSQGNFHLAAKYWAESIRQSGLCHENFTAQKFFYQKQGALDNAGYAYQLAGMTDSADFYYKLDLKLINDADSVNLIDKQYINGARTVLYDNLGGLNLKLGNLAVAVDYLTKCLAIPGKDADGIKIPPLIKLAEVYMKLGDKDKAGAAFSEGRGLLDRFEAANLPSEITWNKLYAQYIFPGQPVKAFGYLTTYIKLKDSMDKSSSVLYRLDVERELSAMQQKQSLAELKLRNNEKKVYIEGITVIVILSLIIIISTNRNLKRAKKEHGMAAVRNQQLEHALTELENTNKNYIRIMRVMAHDLRNPLSGMTGIASVLLEDDEFSGENRHMLKLMETTGTNSLKMINELLKSGLADETEEITKQRVDLKSLLYDSVELLQFKAKEKQQQLLFESDDTPIIVEANYEKMWRTINNLIINAIKFSYAGGTICVGIRAYNKLITIWVADNGVGIPPAQKNIIFDMFTDAKKPGTEGEQPFGLGLSISKKIIELHNGRIWFENNEGGGTVFYIELPAAG